MWLGAALECVPTRNFTVQRLQCSTMVALVAVRQATLRVQIAQAFRTSASIPGRVGMQATRAKIRRSGAQTASGARICWSAALECATLLPMQMALAS